MVLYPCDGISTERLVAAAAYHQGMTYIRTTRPKTPVIYSTSQRFEIGGSNVLRESDEDEVTIVAAGITVFEALKAYEQLKREGTLARVIDAYSLQPIDRATLVRSGRQTGHRIVTVEDHYQAGGLGDAVGAAVGDEGIGVHRLAVREIPAQRQVRRAARALRHFSRPHRGRRETAYPCRASRAGRQTLRDRICAA